MTMENKIIVFLVFAYISFASAQFCNHRIDCPSKSPVCNWQFGEDGHCEFCPSNCTNAGPYIAGYKSPRAVSICCEKCPDASGCDDPKLIEELSSEDYKAYKCGYRREQRGNFCPSDQPVCNWEFGEDGYCETCPSNCANAGPYPAGYKNPRAVSICCEKCPDASGCDNLKLIEELSSEDLKAQKCHANRKCPTDQLCNFEYWDDGYCQICPSNCNDAGLKNERAVANCREMCSSTSRDGSDDPKLTQELSEDNNDDDDAENDCVCSDIDWENLQKARKIEYDNPTIYKGYGDWIMTKAFFPFENEQKCNDFYNKWFAPSKFGNLEARSKVCDQILTGLKTPRRVERKLFKENSNNDDN